MLSRIVLIIVLFFVNIFTGVGIVYTKHSARKSFIELQSKQNTYDELQVEWGRLQLEQSAWATHGRIEKIAREKLNMDLVHEDRLVFLESQ